MTSPKIEAAIAFLEANLHRELSLDETARSVVLSRWHLCRLFKSETGVPPIQYLKMLRMEKACLLLKTSFMSIKEISAKAGFKDESHFLRDFKKTYGLTPTQYRAKHSGWD